MLAITELSLGPGKADFVLALFASLNNLFPAVFLELCVSLVAALVNEIGVGIDHSHLVAVQLVHKEQQAQGGEETAQNN